MTRRITPRVIHVPRFPGKAQLGARTFCGLLVERVPVQPHGDSTLGKTEALCVRCSVIRRMRHEKQVSK